MTIVVEKTIGSEKPENTGSVSGIGRRWPAKESSM